MNLQAIYRALCLEKFIEAEIKRLDVKERILRERGELTPTEKRFDEEERALNRLYLEAAQP